MKKVFKIILLLMFIIPISVRASIFDIPGTDVIIGIDEDIWRVLTREDIANKELLEEYQLDYDQINDLFNKNDIYMNAITYFEDDYPNSIELFVRKTASENCKYFDDLSEEEKQSLAYQLANDSNSSIYDFFINQNINYIYYEYYENDLYVANYYTIYNGYSYSFTFQSTLEINDYMREKYDNIIDNITFDESLTNGVKEKDNKLANTILLLLIFVPVAIVVIIGIKNLLKKNNK